MVGRRHPSGEISAKLAQANELAAKGKTQREIAKALGVSIMTYHRWKKTAPASSGGNVGRSQPESSGALGRDGMVEQLEQENTRLRRLVTDLLLEKLKLEEDIRARNEARFRRSR
jgi:putative transposase